MNNYEKLYWITRLEGLKDIAQFVMVIAIIMIIVRAITIVTLWISDEDVTDNLKNVRRIFNLWIYIPMLVIGMLSYNLIPTNKEVLFIIAGGKTIDFVQADSSIQKMPSQATAIISEFFDNQLKELKKDNNAK